jgi:hypothetical protein
MYPVLQYTIFAGCNNVAVLPVSNKGRFNKKLKLALKLTIF